MNDQVLPVGDPHHVLAASGVTDDRTRVLKHDGDTFAVFDHLGHFKPGGLGEAGLYHDGTRYLSCLMLELDGRTPFFLGSTVRDENDQLSVAADQPRRGSGWARRNATRYHSSRRSHIPLAGSLSLAIADQESWIASSRFLPSTPLPDRLRRHLRGLRG